MSFSAQHPTRTMAFRIPPNSVVDKRQRKAASLAVLYINNDSAAGSQWAPKPGRDQNLTVTSEEESSKHRAGGFGNYTDTRPT